MSDATDTPAADPARDLLDCFFASCESAFRFLEAAHGFARFGGLVSFQKGRKIIMPARGYGGGVFHALTRYEKGSQAVEIFYAGDRFTLEGHLYFDFVDKLDFTDILQAARKNDSASGTASWLTRKNALKDKIGAMGACFEKHKTLFLDPDRALIQRAFLIRAKRLEDAVRAQYKRDLEDASLRAARAFSDKDYRRVVAILTPHERNLGGAERKKLERARRFLLGPA